MLSRPTTDQVLEGVQRDLDELVLPALSDEPARVAVGMMRQLVRGAAVRAAHEIAWMHEEIEQILAAVDAVRDDAGVSAALAELDELDTGSLHLADVQERYHRAGLVLSAAVEAAYAADDRATV